MKYLVDLINKRLIHPVLHSMASVSQVSWGVGIGIFLGFTPTVGVQMYLAALVWGFCRYLLNFRFNLPVSVAMVWISNPLTMIPMYYGFLTTGCWVQGKEQLTYATFESRLTEILSIHSAWGSIVSGAEYLLIELGEPMMLGSLFFAFPIAIGSYFLTYYGLLRHRQHKAHQAQMSYEEWCATHEIAP